MTVPTPEVEGPAGNITYDDRNRMVRFVDVTTGQQHEYRYDPLNRRIEKTIDVNGSPVTTRYVYDGWRVIEERDASATVIVTYVYGPDYVDEFVLETYPDTGGNQVPVYVLQDANYNVVALLDASGNVLEQYTWEPYGQIVIRDVATSALDTRLGHQGLFFYRFDNTSPNAALNPDAIGLYYNRNRWYSPLLGRFTTGDPNETSALTLGGWTYHGEPIASTADAYSPSGHYSDGLNHYAYVGNNPLVTTDPAGLVYDPFADADDAAADLTGHKVATLGHIQSWSGYALFGTKAALDIAGSLLGLDLVKSASNIIKGEGTFEDFLTAGIAAAPVVGAAAWKAIKWGSKYSKMRKAKTRLRLNRLAGLEFEDYVLKLLGHSKNTSKISHNGVNAIPDILSGGVIAEIKKGKSISMSPQLRAISGYANSKGTMAILYVADTVEYISGPVKKAFNVKILSGP